MSPIKDIVDKKWERSFLWISIETGQTPDPFPGMVFASKENGGNLNLFTGGEL
jgi:hypothetical protein